MELIEQKYFRWTVYSLEFLAMVFVGFFLIVRLLVHGADEVKVPSLKGKSVQEAEILLRSSNLRLFVQEQQFNSEFPDGSIVFQEIPSGESVRVGRMIHVILSKGPREQYAPQVVGIEDQTAKTLLTSSSLQVMEAERSCSDYVGNNLVLAQNPRSNETLLNSEVSLLVSNGACFNRYVMPDLRNLPLQEVLSEMDQKKFTTRWIRYQERSDLPPNIILLTEPSAGSIVEPEDAITLEISTEPKEEGWLSEVHWHYMKIHSNPGFSPLAVQLFLERGLPELTYSIDFLLTPGENVPIALLAPSGSAASLLVEGKEVWRKEIE